VSLLSFLSEVSPILFFQFLGVVAQSNALIASQLPIIPFFFFVFFVLLLVCGNHFFNHLQLLSTGNLVTLLLPRVVSSLRAQ